MRYDLVPRFSPAPSVRGLKEELMALDYKALLTQDLMADPASGDGEGGAELRDRGCERAK